MCVLCCCHISSEDAGVEDDYENEDDDIVKLPILHKNSDYILENEE
jgi:hypothetical protein